MLKGARDNSYEDECRGNASLHSKIKFKRILEGKILQEANQVRQEERVRLGAGTRNMQCIVASTVLARKNFEN